MPPVPSAPVLHRLLIFGLLAALVAFAAWDIYRRNPGLFQRASPRPGPRPRPVPSSLDVTPTGKVLAFQRPAHEVLEVRANADDDEIDAAYERLSEAYQPERLAGMSEELRELAARRTAELDRAYRSLKDRP